jgi:cysteine-rich repeat protein
VPDLGAHGQALVLHTGVATLAESEVLAINFQDPSSPAPSGYLKDFGEPFGVRTGLDQGHLAFGWVVPGSHVPLDLAARGTTPGNGRKRGTPDDPRLATFMHMQADDQPASFDGVRASGAFELSLADGLYRVLVAVGDAEQFDSRHGVDVEGVPAIVDFVPSPSAPFLQQEVVAAVSDGTLTLTATGENTKLDFIEVRLAAEASRCGDGVITPGETCDDGNASSGDGCDESCALEGPCVPALSQFPGRTLSPLACEDVKIATPFEADFSGAGTTGLLDGRGHALGFSMCLPSSNGVGYRPSLLALDGGELAITTSAGILTDAVETQDNALGVGLALPNGTFRIETTLVQPPPGTGQYEQAGLWFGISESDYLKLALMSAPSGHFVQALIERGDVGTTARNVPIELPLDRVQLALEADPVRREVRAFARLGAGADEVPVASFGDVPDAWFSTDGAGIDFSVGTRSFAGVFASHRARNPELGPLTFRFADFAVSSVVTPSPEPPAPPSSVDFARYSAPLANPTALAWGPDGRLYVATVSGPIHALTFDHETRAVVRDDVSSSLAGRLVLGLTVDPESTPEDVVLWAGHSDVQQSSGDANSGMVSRLSGPLLATRRDVITGLPRAIANHSTNNLHFGPDGRLYIAQGGNTGAGAANDSISEFGPRPEQPLSAAILVADVKAPDFDGSCTPADDPTGARMDATGIASRDVPCDVAVHASGLRNAFDFTFRENGQLYAVDNGLGVEGAYPALAPDPLDWDPASGCEGPVLGPEHVAAHNPGTRADLLYRIEPGGYYGHPNPARDECVFFGGNPTEALDGPVKETGGLTHFQEAATYPVGVLPEPNFRPALFSFGDHKSASGIIEYTGDAFCGALRGDLLVNYYSGFDQVRRLTLDPGETQVLSDATLRRSSMGSGGPTQLVDPLGITQDALGRIYVAEFGGGRVTVFDPRGPGCWSQRGAAPLPIGLSDAGAALLGGELYVVGGRTGTTPLRSLFVYDPNVDAWRREADLPPAHPAVTHPAVVAAAGRLYVLGGFAGAGDAVSAASTFEPATGRWDSIAPLPAPRAAAAAQLLAAELHVIGGSDAGLSRAEHFVYSFANESWSAGAPLAAPRERHMSAVVDGRLLVLGGSRAGTSADAAALTSVEAYDPATNAWVSLAPLLTPRRSGTATLTRGQLVVTGGADAAALVATEGYDPTTSTWTRLPPAPIGRVGAVGARFGNGVYIVGGAIGATSNPSPSVDVLHID